MKDLTHPNSNESHECETVSIDSRNNVIGIITGSDIDQNNTFVEKKNTTAEQTGVRSVVFSNVLRSVGTIASGLWFLVALISFFGMESTITAEDTETTVMLLAVQLLACLWIFGLCNPGILADNKK